jgi:hypothetical protein
VLPPCAAPHGSAFAARGDTLSAVKISGIVLIAAGILGLAYGGFSYTKETRREAGERLVAAARGLGGSGE